MAFRYEVLTYGCSDNIKGDPSMLSFIPGGVPIFLKMTIHMKYIVTYTKEAD